MCRVFSCVVGRVCLHSLVKTLLAFSLLHSVLQGQIFRKGIGTRDQNANICWIIEKARAGADCGSDHEFLIAKLKFKLENIGKTTRPFRYKLNQIPYDYTVEVTNRFKELDLIDRA